jgi:ABC-type multidrug transport system ATPase subunit
MYIQTEALNKSFRRHEALHGVSLRVPEGAIYALIGANGAGKTTTIKALLNIIAPTSGRAEVLGVDSRRLSPREYAQIGYVSENQELPRRLTVQAPAPGVASLNAPWLVAATGGAIYVMDDNRDQAPVLLKITPQGVVSKLAGPDSN